MPVLAIVASRREEKERPDGSLAWISAFAEMTLEGVVRALWNMERWRVGGERHYLASEARDAVVPAWRPAMAQ